MPENRGLYMKFQVVRNDGRDRPGGDRQGAVYFVLDLRHDPIHSKAALKGYRDSLVATGDLPELVAELDLFLAGGHPWNVLCAGLDEAQTSRNPKE